MPQYTVQPGDSWAKIAGMAYGDQRQFVNLMNANGGRIMIHPGEVIEVPESFEPNPYISQGTLQELDARAQAQGFNNFFPAARTGGQTGAGGGGTTATAGPSGGPGNVPPRSGDGRTQRPPASPVVTSQPGNMPSYSQLATQRPPRRAFGVQQYDQPIGPEPDTWRLPTDGGQGQPNQNYNTFLPMMQQGTPPAPPTQGGTVHIPMVQRGAPPAGPDSPEAFYGVGAAPFQAVGGLLQGFLNWLASQQQGSLDAYYDVRSGQPGNLFGDGR